MNEEQLQKLINGNAIIGHLYYCVETDKWIRAEMNTW